MPIIRSKHQSDTSLQAFYQEHITTRTDTRAVAEQMLLALDLINSLFIKTTLIGMTSHQKLVIMPNEPNKSDDMWKVKIANIGVESYYYIEYKLPKSTEPWEYAWVNGPNFSFNELKKYLLIAMRESKGWEGNQELEALLKENGL